MINVRSKTFEHLRYFAETIGERPAGSPANHQAEAYVRESFQSNGLEIEEVRVPFPDWSLERAYLAHDGQSLALNANPFSPACDVTAPTVAISTLSELEAANITGKVALLYGELSSRPIFPINFMPVRLDRDIAINKLLMEKAPAAVLAVNLHPTRHIDVFEDEDFPLPSATIPVAEGNYLLQHVGKSVHLRIDVQSRDSHVTTLIGRTDGDQQRRIVVSAHFDTKFNTPGAQDNGTAMAVLLTLAEMLAGRDLPVGLDFVAWGDEEFGAHTDTAYVERYRDQFPQMMCCINMDGIGPRAENTTLTMLAQSEVFEQQMHDITTDYPAVVWVDPWYASNHYTYFANGVPALVLGSLTMDRTHQPDDSIEWISEAKLDEVTRLVLDIIMAIQDQSTDWTRA